MILQALYELAQREELMADPDFQRKPVAWLVRIDAAGRCMGIVGTHYLPPTDGKRKSKPKAKTFRVPYQPGRSGIQAPPCFFVDNAKYVFGRPTSDKSFDERKGKAKAAAFCQEIRRCVEATGDEAARAVLTFLEDMASGKTCVELPKECVSNDLFAFIYTPDGERLVHERPAIQDYWKKKRREGQAQEGRFQCLVSGRPIAEPGLFPKLKNVPGGSTSGVGLVSFNKKAFCSYGLERNENAPISRFAAESCATALNRLLDPRFPDPHHEGETMPPRCYRISGDTAVCFWAIADQAQEFCDQFVPLAEANPEDVKEMYQAIWTGRSPQGLDTSAFYALTLSGTQGRAIVRDWLESTVADVAAHLAAYFRDLQIVRNTPQPRNRPLPPQLPMRLLARSLAPQGRNDGIPPHLSAQMVHTALAGTRFPMTVLHRALERMRAEIGRSDWNDMELRDARAALIKAVLIRNFGLEVTPDMDTTNKDIGYLLGRLLAVIERAQQLALGDVNATVIDRYFSGASATPGAVFPRLLKNMRHHISKARDGKYGGAAVWLDRQADEIASQIDAFPAFLPLPQQGLFILGYHHQRHALWQKKDGSNSGGEP